MVPCFCARNAAWRRPPTVPFKIGGDAETAQIVIREERLRDRRQIGTAAVAISSELDRVFDDGTRRLRIFRRSLAVAGRQRGPPTETVAGISGAGHEGSRRAWARIDRTTRHSAPYRPAIQAFPEAK